MTAPTCWSCCWISVCRIAATTPAANFDPLDLGNVGLTLRRSPRWVAMRWWPRSLRECGVAGKLIHRLTVKVACPTPGETHRRETAAHPRALAAADPASRWGLLDAGQWPAGRSPHGILGRRHRELPPLVTHCGVPVQAELALSRQPDHHEISH